ncbi:hypothetical protein [Rhodococcus opacus]|uniref:hypothetical protein n=1 Tax=Rhodococcus opacus TaxID=37919 RepID=UPI002235DF07|nr:hypothetical protein [Rhodococcus opacus]UZG60515.1 hypothetical protein ONE62_39960 [Rhodococcus opacus]
MVFGDPIVGDQGAVEDHLGVTGGEALAAISTTNASTKGPTSTVSDKSEPQEQEQKQRRQQHPDGSGQELASVPVLSGSGGSPVRHP